VAGLLGFFEPLREITRRVLNGDQEELSFDTSKWREGSGFNIPLTSGLAVLGGNQLVMKYFSHNVPCDENGKFYGRDDTGGCTIQLYDENENWRWYGAPSANRGVSPVWTQYTVYNSLTGAWTYSGTITPSQTLGIVGTTTNNNAQAGSVGEVVTSSITANTISLTTATSANIGSISLTAGDWDVEGAINFTPTTTTSITVLEGGISSGSSATLPGLPNQFQESMAAAIPGTTVAISKVVPMVRLSLASTTTVYLVAQGTFTVSTLQGGGVITARRRR
jgi:hypothetical protein